MKCGIITMHKVVNYGATFQALALYKNICKIPGLDVEFIDYKMNPPPKTKIVNKRSIFSKVTKNLNRVRNVKRYFNVKKREKKFISFWNNHYILSKKKYSGDDSITKYCDYYDLCIAGSDQLFNLKLTNHSIGYFLPIDAGKKISYSTSFGMNGLDKSYKNIITKYLSDFDALSVREQDALDVLTKWTGKKCVVSADPVFLLSLEEWRCIAKPVKIPDRYIFCYIMSDNPNIEECIKWIKSKEDIPVIVVKTHKKKLTIKCKYYESLGPDEFLYIILHASYVVTNSFHGCALSFIFGKKVFSLEEKQYIGDKRYKAMFFHAQTEGKIVPYDTNWNNYDFEENLIDGRIAYKNMSKWINESKEYIQKNTI